MAAAQCGTPTAKLHKQAWRVGDPTALLTQAADTEEPIVGMWHVMFTAEGNSEGPPNGTPIDNAIIVWHGDAGGGLLLIHDLARGGHTYSAGLCLSYAVGDTGPGRGIVRL
jgi:hypothetical protein